MTPAADADDARHQRRRRLAPTASNDRRQADSLSGATSLNGSLKKSLKVAETLAGNSSLQKNFFLTLNFLFYLCADIQEHFLQIEEDLFIKIIKRNAGANLLSVSTFLRAYVCSLL